MGVFFGSETLKKWDALQLIRRGFLLHETASGCRALCDNSIREGRGFTRREQSWGRHRTEGPRTSMVPSILPSLSPGTQRKMQAGDGGVAEQQLTFLGGGVLHLEREFNPIPRI